MDLPFVLLFLAVIWWASGMLVIVPAAAITLILVFALVIQRPLGRVVNETFMHNSAKSAFLHEVAVGLDTLRSSNGQGWARNKWDGHLSRSAEVNKKSRQISVLSVNFSGTVATLTTIGTVSLGAVLVIQGQITPGALIAATILSGRAVAPLAQMANLLGRWQHTKQAIHGLDNLMKAPTEIGDDKSVLQSFPVRGGMSFRGLAFAYPPAVPMQPGVDVLGGITAEISKGEHVGIVGRVGSGKSTLLDLIVNLNNPTDGHVLIDGVDARQVHPAELRSQIGYCRQDSLLFNGTIMTNISEPHPDIEEDRILEAVRIVGLDVLLSSSAMGLATPVGERGMELSGGLRQAVALARAIVHRPSILLLDEPTSMMDHSTEKAFLARLKEDRKGLTTIIATHRTAPLSIVERLLVLDQGKLVMDGPRNEVLRNLKEGSNRD